MVTKYVRPGPNDKGGSASYGDESGDSYANAYAGLDHASLNKATVTELFVCGFHAPTQAEKVAEDALLFTAGTAKQPVVIRGDYAADRGIICGGSFYTGLTWEDSTDRADANTAVLSATIAANGFTYVDFLFEDTVGNGDFDDVVKLASVADLATCQTTDQSFYWDSGGSVVYVNCAGSWVKGDVDGNILFSNFGNWLGGDSSGPSPHVIWTGIHLFGIRYIVWKHAANLQFHRCRISYIPGSVAKTTGGVTDLWFNRCHISDTPSVFYPYSPATPGETARWFMTHNLIYDIGKPEFITDIDAHVLGPQGLVVAKFDNNTVDGAGRPIELWLSNNDYMHFITVNHNSIRGTHLSGGDITYGTSSTGIVALSFGTPDPVAGDIKDVVFHGNLLFGATAANVTATIFRNKWPDTDEAVTLTENILDGNGTAENCYRDTADGNHYLRSNVFLDADSRFFWASGCTLGNYDGDLNTFIGTPSSAFGSMDGVVYASLTTWQAAAGTHDPNSTTA